MGLLDAVRDPISEAGATREMVIDGWTRAAKRVAPSRSVIALCRAVRRNEVIVTPPAEWIADNPEAATWCVPTLSERRTLDENMVNTVQGDGPIYFSRTPLSSTDTGEEDADDLETYCDAVAERCIDSDTLHGQIVENGEFGWVVAPDTARLESPPSYDAEDAETDTADQEAGEGEVKPKKRTPKPIYDRGSDAKPITRKDGESASEYSKRRSEKLSRAAYDEEYLAWLAEHYPVSVRIIHPLDCAPVVVSSTGADPFEVRGLAVRTLYDVDDLLEMGFSWRGMNNPDKGASLGKHAPAPRKAKPGTTGPALVPRAWGTDPIWGENEQIYLYEFFWQTPKGHAICAYTVGGVGTWFGDQPMSEDGHPLGDKSAAILDFTDEYGLPPFETLWGYAWGLHTTDDIAYRARPWLAHFLSDIVNIEALRLALITSVWEDSFTGHYLKPDDSLPTESWLQTRPDTAPTLRRFKKPRPGGSIETYPGEVVPFHQASAGKDAWTYLQYLHGELKANAPAAQQSGAETDASGHSLVVQHSLLLTSKGQMRKAILKATSGIMSRILMLVCAYATVGVKGADGKRHLLPWLPIPVTAETILPNGEIRDRTEVIQPQERWIGKNYHLKTQYPDEGDLAEVEQAASLAERGFASDEDVYKARGKRSTIRERIKIANYQYIMRSPIGQTELQLRAAKIRGDKMRQQILEGVLAQISSPGGTPLAAVDGQGLPPGQMPMPGTGGGAGGPMPTGPGPSNGGPTSLPNTAQSSLNGAISGAMNTGPMNNDARAVAQIRGS